jgi:signal transduction histidine kinase
MAAEKSNRIRLAWLSPRSLWRTTDWIGPQEIRRTERWLATARVFLAISALIAVWVDPGEIRSIWAYALLAFYIAQGTAIIFLLRSRQQSTAAFRVLVHAADIVWPALICLLTTSQSNPFFLFFLFVLAAAAYRWGLWETVMTAVSAVSLLWLESLALHVGVIHPINAWLQHHRLPPLNVDLVDYEPKRLFMRSVYLIVMALLLGYLAEQQKKLRAEREEAARMLGRVSIEAGLTGTLTEIVGALLRLYGAPRALIASREGGTGRMSVGLVQLKNDIALLTWQEPGPAGADIYLGDLATSSCYVQSRASAGHQEFVSIALGDDGAITSDADSAVLQRFAEVHPFHRMLALSFSPSPELSGRVFLLEPQLASSAEEELRFLQDLARQVGPAVYNVYLLRRLRRRAGALERARLVRDLHDGAVQSLIGVEMQVDVLRRSDLIAEPVSDELERIQKLLRDEVAKLRELMQQMKSVDVDGQKLPGFLRDAVQRFQRETGIAATFLMDEGEVVLSQPVCRELARIAQEALVNVRKHSGAKQVFVHLLHSDGSWELVVEDDGAGFPFDGRIAQSELDRSSRAPAVIRERARLIQGELTIESRPGRGARIEVRVPQPQPTTNG